MKELTTLDRLDLRILQVLQQQGRITNQLLAEKVNLSPSSCLHRVRRLEEQNFIVSYQANLQLANICRTITCIATVTLSNPSQEDFVRFETLAKDIPEIIECLTVSGGFDYVVKVIATDMTAYLEIMDQLIEDMKSGANISTHVVMKEIKPFRGFPIERLL